MNIFGRIALFVISAAILAVIYFLYREGLPIGGNTPSVICLSALLTLSFSILLIEHWFTKPTDVLANCVAVLLAMAPSRGSLEKMGIWFDLFFLYVCIVMVIAITALGLLDPESGVDSRRNSASRVLRDIAVRVGSAKLLYFVMFALTATFYFDSQKPIFLALFLFAGLLLVLDPRHLPRIFRPLGKVSSTQIGEIIGVQSRHTYIARLLNSRPAVRRYDFVEFDDGGEGRTSRKGIIVDRWVLNSQQWVKIVSGSDITLSLGREQVCQELKPNLVYKIAGEDTAHILDRFVGTVSEQSNILAIRFDYGMRVPVTEGTLIEVSISNDRVLYQVTSGVTEVEVLENKNEAGLIIGHAAQIGIWNPETLTFDRFGWVPEINTPVYIASQIEPVQPPDGEMVLGYIPDTNYPIFMDKQVAINCHMAILGVTGTGKSVFARNIIRQLAAGGMKFVCVDFTGEYKRKLSDVAPVDMVGQVEATQIFAAIDTIADEMIKFPNQRNYQAIAAAEQQISFLFRQAILNFRAHAQNVAIFELPDVANSTSILSYTRWFFKVLFEIAKEGNQLAPQMCVVLEEAHTVIPEWSFMSAEDKGAQALLNQIAQIALQGRKYGVGFLVIAQRTANVSKTVLTQCNTIVAFQQFDKTSSDFLGNYIGPNMIDALQGLRPRQAVAVGKAFRSGIPTIFKVPDIIEPIA